MKDGRNVDGFLSGVITDPTATDVTEGQKAAYSGLSGTFKLLSRDEDAVHCASHHNGGGSQLERLDGGQSMRQQSLCRAHFQSSDLVLSDL